MQNKNKQRLPSRQDRPLGIDATCQALPASQLVAAYFKDFMKLWGKEYVTLRKLSSKSGKKSLTEIYANS